MEAKSQAALSQEVRRVIRIGPTILRSTRLKIFETYKATVTVDGNPVAALVRLHHDRDVCSA